MRYSGLALALLLLAACSQKTGTTSSGSASSDGRYTEDLSVWRPRENPDSVANTQSNKKNTVDLEKRKASAVDAKFTVNEQLDLILDSIAEVNLQNNLVDGFTIQVYSGVKREDALNVKKEMSQKLPDVHADVQYVQPNYRVRAGKYYDRYDAQRDYMAIKKHFPNAVILPDRIPIK